MTVLEGRQPPEPHVEVGGLKVLNREHCRQFSEKARPPHDRGGRSELVPSTGSKKPRHTTGGRQEVGGGWGSARPQQNADAHHHTIQCGGRGERAGPGQKVPLVTLKKIPTCPQ